MTFYAEKHCNRCGETFSINRKPQSERKYCSRQCSTKAIGESRRTKKDFTCQICSKAFEGFAYRDAKFCSKACWSVRNPPKEKSCPVCNIAFLSRHKKQITCSKICGGKRRSSVFIGSNSARWKDGKSLERQRGRLQPQLKEWRKQVYAKDAFTCQDCGATKKLQAHHIKPFAEFPELAFDISNGVTLCIHCHGKRHGVDFAAQKIKHCPECGTKTTGRGKGGRCKPCAMQIMHNHRASLRVQQPVP